LYQGPGIKLEDLVYDYNEEELRSHAVQIQLITEAEKLSKNEIIEKIFIHFMWNREQEYDINDDEPMVQPEQPKDEESAIPKFTPARTRRNSAEKKHVIDRKEEPTPKRRKKVEKTKPNTNPPSSGSVIINQPRNCKFVFYE
jgi:hypothetical protein